MRIIFMGTPEFAVPSLQRLVANGYKPVAVVTGPDRPRGRGQKMSPTPVKEAALASGITTVLQPESVKEPAFARQIAELEPDVMVVVAFRILPPEVFTLAKKGAFNLHGSLLPKYRGAAPINRAIMAGEVETGVTTFFLERAVDTGSVILQRPMPIEPYETAGEVHDRMMELGADAVLETVRLIDAGQVRPQPQNDARATPAPKIFKEDARIPWQLPAQRVHNHIRALSPYPGAWAMHGDTQFKIYHARPAEGKGEPGEVLAASGRLVVACAEGAVEVLGVQQEGKRRMSAADFLRGYSLDAGGRLR